MLRFLACFGWTLGAATYLLQNIFYAYEARGSGVAYVFRTIPSGLRPNGFVNGSRLRIREAVPVRTRNRFKIPVGSSTSNSIVIFFFLFSFFPQKKNEKDPKTHVNKSTSSMTSHAGHLDGEAAMALFIRDVAGRVQVAVYRGQSTTASRNSIGG